MVVRRRRRVAFFVGQQKFDYVATEAVLARQHRVGRAQAMQSKVVDINSIRILEGAPHSRDGQRGLPLM